MFGSSSFFGTPSSTPSLFGTFRPTPGFGTPQSTPAFGTPQSTPAFGTPQSTPAFVTSFFPQQQQQQQQTPFSLFPQTQQQQQSQFGQSMFNVGFQQPQQQITTQMAPVAPITMSLVDRDLMAIVDAYKEEPGNPKYAFRHLLFSVTDSAARVKPVGVSDIMWAEAMGKLEGMESVDRERLWPQLVQGFKDLSNRLKLQDEVIVSDEERLRTTQSNVKLLQRHFQSDTLPRIQRLKHKEQALQSRLIRVMRIVEALEGKGFRMGLTKNEIDLYEKLSEIFRKVKGPASELPKRVHNLLSITRANANVGVGSTYLPVSAIIQEQSLTEMQEVLQHQTEAFSKLANVLKRDRRDLEIMSEGTDVVDRAGRQTLKT